MSDHGQQSGMPPGWKRGPDGQVFRAKKDGSWWWQASDGNWYPEASHPNYRAAPPPPPPPPEPTAVFSIPARDPLPRRAWTTYRGWPRAAQIGLAAGLVVVVAAIVAPKDDPTDGAAGPTTLVTTSPTLGRTTTTAELVLPKASTTPVVTATAPLAPRAAVAAIPDTTDPPVTDPPATDPPATDPPAADPPGASCDPSYPDICIPQDSADLDCGEIPHRNFTVLPPDPHDFDRGGVAGIGCESP